jgi:hypothetical protein
LAAAVEQRLRAERPGRPLRKRRLAVALAVALIVPVAAFATVPSLRHAVLDVLGARGVQIVRTTSLPPLPPGGRLELGEPTSLTRAGGLVRFRVLAPHIGELGAADEAYYRPLPAGGALSLVYRPRADLPRSPFTKRGLLLTEFLGSDAPLFARKFAGAGTSVEPVSVNGRAGVWLAGRPHEFAYVDERGQTEMETIRLAGNTLVWERGRLTLRLEGAISKGAALRIARSVR